VTRGRYVYKLERMIIHCVSVRGIIKGMHEVVFKVMHDVVVRVCMKWFLRL